MRFYEYLCTNEQKKRQVFGVPPDIYMQALIHMMNEIRSSERTLEYDPYHVAFCLDSFTCMFVAIKIHAYSITHNTYKSDTVCLMHCNFKRGKFCLVYCKYKRWQLLKI
ncbi:hypothetical protein Lal_00001633 [Lupinus albus]|nr:hypothetical protein Lal_00001633 [Lupinus albus]